MAQAAVRAHRWAQGGHWGWPCVPPPEAVAGTQWAAPELGSLPGGAWGPPKDPDPPQGEPSCVSWGWVPSSAGLNSSLAPREAPPSFTSSA
ncbi:hypothetical protein MC885_018836 [Smutsia gigantea]|nr:hypothetical protein MC885_018836 [Smutsia gigantea]